MNFSKYDSSWVFNLHKKDPPIVILCPLPTTHNFNKNISAFTYYCLCSGWLWRLWFTDLIQRASVRSEMGRQSTLLSAFPRLIVGRKSSLEAWFIRVFKDIYTLLDILLMSTLAGVFPTDLKTSLPNNLTRIVFPRTIYWVTLYYQEDG